MHFLTTREASKLLDLSPDMIRKLERDGQLMAVKIPRGDLAPQRLFILEDVERLQKIRAAKCADKNSGEVHA